MIFYVVDSLVKEIVDSWEIMTRVNKIWVIMTIAWSSLDLLRISYQTCIFSTWILTRVTRRVWLVEQKLLTIPEHMSTPRFLWDSCYSILIFCVMFYRSLFVLFLLAIVLSVNLLPLNTTLVYSNFPWITCDSVEDKQVNKHEALYNTSLSYLHTRLIVSAEKITRIWLYRLKPVHWVHHTGWTLYLRHNRIWLSCPPQMRQIKGSSHDRVKPKTIKFVFDASPLSMQH